jgi:Mg2+ transporter MgtE
MIYLSRMLGKPVIDAAGAEIGTINDIAIATGEIFPRVTSLAFQGPDKTPFMLSWRKYVADFDNERIQLNVPAKDIRFSYLQPDEVLLHRDLLNKQIVDTHGMKVVRVNDLKLSESKNQLRLLGAEVGLRGILRGIAPALERAVEGAYRLFGREFSENLIAWNYMDLLDRDLSHVQLSVTHKRLHELHPADVADILEKLSATQRGKVFEHLDNTQAAEAISELEDEFQADVIDDLGNQRASAILGMMDPDDAADIIGDLSYDKAEMLLRLMGVKESRAIRSLLGYKEKTAGGIMTPEVTTVTEDMTVSQVIEFLRSEAAEHESIYYIYVVEGDRRLTGVISLRDLIMSQPDTPVAEFIERDVITVLADEDQEDVAETMSKYDLLALPVLDENGKLLGIVTVDDALEVMEEESAEDLALATGSQRAQHTTAAIWWWLARRSTWVAVWVASVAAIYGLISHDILGSAGASAGMILSGVAVLMPLVLRTAEDTASRVIAELIEDPDVAERPGLGRLMLTDGLAGLGVALIGGLLAFALYEIASGEPMMAASLGLATGFALAAVTVIGVLLTLWARRRSDADRTVSGTGLGIALMVVGVIVYLAFGLVAAISVERIGI